MTIRKWYEISCNECSQADYYQGDTQKHANIQAKKNGWFIEGRRHYCDEECLNFFTTRKRRLNQRKPVN